MATSLLNLYRLAYCSVYTVLLRINSSFFLLRMHWMPPLPSLLNLVTSLNWTFNQHKEAWLSLDLIKSERSFLFLADIIAWIPSCNTALKFFQYILEVEIEYFFKQDYTVFEYGDPFQIWFWCCGCHGTVLPARSYPETARSEAIAHNYVVLELLNGKSHNFLVIL